MRVVGAARLALALVPGEGLAPGLLPGAARTRLELVHHGHPAEAAALTLLGQDARRAWSGPAAFAAAAAGRVVREGETAWLLEPVRVSGDGKAVLEGPLPLGAAPLADALEHLAPELPAGATIVAGEPSVLVTPGALDGPSTAVAELLPGRGLETFLEASPAVRTVVSASAHACREAGVAATHLVAHSPAGPLVVRPLRDVWPAVRSAAVVGATGAARALALLLGVDHTPAAPGGELVVAAEALNRHDVVVVLLGAPTNDLGALGAAGVVVAASEPDAEGAVELAVQGAPAPTDAADPLRRLVGPR